tara:strand:- start:94 stop:1119 length:1026 start_codon:yes stop_codon:yes gene_type:complete
MPHAEPFHVKCEEKLPELGLTHFSDTSDNIERPALPQRSKSALSPRIVFDAGKSLRRTGSDLKKTICNGRSKQGRNREVRRDVDQKRTLRSRSIDEVFEDCEDRVGRSQLNTVSASALFLDTPRVRSAEDISQYNEDSSNCATASGPAQSADISDLECMRKTVSEMPVGEVLQDVKKWLSSPVMGRDRQSHSSTPCSKTTPPKSPSLLFMNFPRSPPNVMKEFKSAIKGLHSSDEEELSVLLEDWGEMLMREYLCSLDELKIVGNPAYSPHLSLTSRVNRDEAVVCDEISQFQEDSKMKSIFQEIVNTEKNYLAELRKLIWVSHLSITFSSTGAFLIFLQW